MRKQLTTVQQEIKSRRIKRIIKIFITIALFFGAYYYLSNYYFNNSKTISKKLETEIEQEESTNMIKLKDYEKLHNISNEESDNNSDINLTLDTKIDLPYTISKKNEEDSSTIKSENNSQDVDTFSTTSSKKSSTITNLDELDEHYNFYQNNSQAEIDYNNEQINKIKAQQEELNKIKETYEAKKQAIEVWYLKEYNDTYDLMDEAERNIKDTGGRATKDDITNKEKEKASTIRESIDSGLSMSGYYDSKIKQLEKEYEIICKRYSYTKKYDEYYYYLNTTLPALKNEKLLEVSEWYNQELQNYKNKYN